MMNTPEERAAYIISQSAEALIEAMGMQAENAMRAHRGEAVAYSESAFAELRARYTFGNDAVALLNQERR